MALEVRAALERRAKSLRARNNEAGMLFEQVEEPILLRHQSPEPVQHDPAPAIRRAAHLEPSCCERLPGRWRVASHTTERTRTAKINPATAI